MRWAPCLAMVAMVAGCSVADSHMAIDARTRLVGLTELQLESCLGAPDQHTSFGTTDVLTWYANSTSSSSVSVPLVGGMSFSNGGYCHLTARVDQGRVTRIRYTGENNAFVAPFAYCAPIVRSCMNNPEPPNLPQVPPLGAAPLAGKGEGD